MTGYNIQSTQDSPIYKSVVESVIRNTGRGIDMKLVGTRYGLSYDELDARIRGALKEPMYGTPRCQRLRAWNIEKRLIELNLGSMLERSIG